ncbi:hypothetical protein ACTFIR_012049 [Dictyostelium discoideum]
MFKHHIIIITTNYNNSSILSPKIINTTNNHYITITNNIKNNNNNNNDDNNNNNNNNNQQPTTLRSSNSLTRTDKPCVCGEVKLNTQLTGAPLLDSQTQPITSWPNHYSCLINQQLLGVDFYVIQLNQINKQLVLYYVQFQAPLELVYLVVQTSISFGNIGTVFSSIPSAIPNTKFSKTSITIPFIKELSKKADKELSTIQSLKVSRDG